MRQSTWRPDTSSLRDHLRRASKSSNNALFGAKAAIQFAQIIDGSGLNGRREGLRGKSVLILTRDQLPAALAMLEIAGVARRLVLCPPDVGREHLSMIIVGAEV